MAEVEFMVKVKLPSSSSFACCPSGDTEYDTAYRDAIFAVKPPGMEVRWPRANEKWPVDSEGYTWVRLYLSDKQQAKDAALLHWIEESGRLSKELHNLRERVKALAV